MAQVARTWWGLLALLAILGLAWGSLHQSWYTYRFSSGTTLPPEGSQPENDPTLVREARFYYPFGLRGDVNESQVSAVERETETLGVGLAIVLGAAGASLLVEASLARWDWSRWISLPLAVVGLITLGYLLAYAWMTLPDTLAQEGVTGTFSAFRRGDGFVRTNIDFGWILAGLALLAHLAFLGFKYAAGAIDPLALEKYVKRERP